MKNSLQITLSLLCGLLLATVLTGCGSKEEAPDKSVNVSAQIAALKGPAKETVQNACVELAKAGPLAAPAVSTLIPLLKDNDALTRRLAAYALMEIGPAAKEALPALEAIKEDPDRAVAEQVVNSLRLIDPKKYGGEQGAPHIMGQ
jgi:HEAT repeat protein